MSLCILGAKAQNLINADDKLVHFGFNVGINVMDFGIKSSMTPIDGKIYQSEVSSLTPGFSVGVIGDLRLHKFFNLRLIPSLHLGERTLTYMNDIDDELFKTTIKSTCITVPLYIKYSAVRVKNYRPYLLVGGGVNFDLAHDIPCSYQDFKQYCRTEDPDIFRRIDRFYTDADKLWSDFEAEMPNIDEDRLFGWATTLNPE